MKKKQDINVFIDTSIFYNVGFSYNGKVLKKIEWIASMGAIKLHITDITKKEVEKNMLECHSNALKAIKKLKKDTVILRNLEDIVINKIYEKDFLENSFQLLLKKFNEFLDNSKANVISSNNVSINKIFDNYFNMKPPFGHGNKKAEFPDAFIIESLELWCIENKQSMYVVSSDGDMGSACSKNEYLNYFNKLEELFNFLLKQDNYLHAIILKVVRSNLSVINQHISNKFHNLDFVVEDQEGEVLDINVTGTGINDYLVIEIDSNDCVAELSLDTSIYFDAKIEFIDFENSIYDHEEKEYIYKKYTNQTVMSKYECDTSLTIKFSPEDDSVFQIIKILVNNDQEVPIHPD